ncbi:MAG: hypothetical protein OEW19_07020 [Acidobacteriota bacterium]|nr:hypothetical protein [Acidobacteriota bacterium]
MRSAPRALVVFCAAAGPRLGFGHLVRCRSLARALGVEPVIALRGSRRTRDRATAMGGIVVDVSSAASLRALEPSLVVIDDPSATHAGRWLRRARTAGVPVATVHDLGLAYVASDVLIDGSLRTGAAPTGSDVLAGPAYAILDPGVERTRHIRRRPRPTRIFIALGGGHHIHAAAATLTSALARRLPRSDIRVARGFCPPRGLPSLARGTWIEAPNGLAGELAEASVAIVAGGVTLYEACALGVPVVAVAVTAAQHQTIRAAACHGAAIDGGALPLDARRGNDIAEAAARLLTNRARCARQSRAARRLVDARGAYRVAARLRALARRRRPGPKEGAA